ncbi:hypothetical protein, partial [Streptomyces galilaeus]|uniref:hypothetical protein n=1 Tax=Streptomyces galilaeus TaxID=33899 RepID=UPI0038F6F4D2
NGVVYQGFGCTPSWEQWAAEVMSQFWCVNIFLTRNLELGYKEAGRSQSLDQSIEKDNQLFGLLDQYGFEYHKVPILPVVCDGNTMIDET